MYLSWHFSGQYWLYQPSLKSFHSGFMDTIHGHNECQLFNPEQPFDLLFAFDGGAHADEALVVDEAINPVAGSKSGKCTGLVLEHALAQIAGYPGVAFASDWS